MSPTQQTADSARDPRPGAAEEESAGPIERLATATLLSHVVDRLDRLESAGKQDSKEKTARATLLEVLKIVFGGWPVFAFLFLALYHHQVGVALLELGPKIRDAKEISFAGAFSVKVAEVAKSEGRGELAKKIPKLSVEAISLLLKAPRNPESEVSFVLDDKDLRTYLAIRLPGDRFVDNIGELVEAGLVRLRSDYQGRDRSLTGADLKGILTQIQREFPGDTDFDRSQGDLYWSLKEPVPEGKATRFHITWVLTEDGEKAVDIILKAMASFWTEDEDKDPKTSDGH